MSRSRSPLPVALRRLRHHPVVSWSATLGAALLATAIVAAALARAEQAVEAYGTPVDVAVASVDLPIGAVVRPGDIRWEPRPAGLVLDGTVRAGDPNAAPPLALDGRVVVAPIYAGEAVLAPRLAPEGHRGLAALLPPGARALTIPDRSRGPAVQVGDRVDLLRAGSSPLDSFGADGSGPLAPSAARPVATAALVVHVADDGAVTVAVRDDEAPAVAAAIADGTVVQALVAP